MSNRWLSLTLIVALISPTPRAVASGDLQARTAKVALLSDLRGRVPLFISFNEIRLKVLLKCINEMSDADFSAAQFTDRPREQWGCSEEIGLLRNNTRVNFPRMRRFLALKYLYETHRFQDQRALVDQLILRTQGRDGLATDRAQSVSAIPVIEPKIPFEPKWYANPIRYLGDRVKLSNPPFSAAEFSKALQENESMYSYNRSFQEGCDKMVSERLQPYCGRFQVKIESNQWRSTADLSGLELKDLVELRAALLGLDHGMERLRRKAWSLYLKAVQMDPYIALFSTALPNRSQVRSALLTVSVQSDMARTEYTKLDQRLSSPNATQTDYLELLKYSGVVESIMHNPGPSLKVLGVADLDAVKQELESDRYWRIELPQMGVQTIWLLGINAVCIIPWGKMISFGSKLALASKALTVGAALSPWCVEITNAVVNLWMVGSALDRFNQTFEGLFAGIDERHLLVALSDLSTEETNLVLEALMFPMGLGAGKVLTKIRAGAPHISKALLNHLEGRLPALIGR
jgi:hypothetical protein